ncbi:MAG: GTP-binding protein [Candidatus Heimdallarchaeota archaeon]|nr:MAG: GTP-binding protein [Candidatus Heimdallarchaeota archaeon]
MELLKIILIGDGSVGKTSIRRRYLGNGFPMQYLPTLGADFSVKNEIICGKKISFQIWDLAGQPVFETIRKMYYHGARGAFIVCDVSNPESVMNIHNWIDELWRNNGHGPIPFVILGNKIDLRDTGEYCIPDQTIQGIVRGITTTTGEDLPFNVTYLPTSANTGENITEAFKRLGIQVSSHRMFLSQYA